LTVFPLIELVRPVNLLAKTFLAALVFAASSATAVFGADSDPHARAEAFRVFTHCDGGFFALLGREPSPFGSMIELQRSGTVATPAVQNPWLASGRSQRCAEPLDVAGLRLVGWRSEARSDPGAGGAFFWWGFEIEGQPDRVAKAVNDMLALDRRLTFEGSGGGWSHGEARGLNDPLNAWPLPVTPRGVDARPGTVERILILDASTTPGRTRLECSLQGAVTAQLLGLIRPDFPLSR
jgi:hypothetical protein